ncbi:hypothetical protein BZB76_0563 [Actinomadura pelletieri DSM 43383]|uniref:Uncharacterized protein n=1 Tax=Actinomadura pelletieri DSM 43383 TaxID=1120940 RepID=A0A495QY51_9ACTN|nr:hypothetical protein [Actinomadura pelletieri]RKS79121.1 hypothetical protein BZB76_0563 [Actinomadura pelletieri DSM 43383]
MIPELPAPHFPPAPSLPPEPAAPSLPPLPPAPQPDAVVLPPLQAPRAPRPPAGESRLTLMSPTSMNEGDGMDWAVVIGIALVAEFGLLWTAACIGLWRRRIALNRAVSRALDDGRTPE